MTLEQLGKKVVLAIGAAFTLWLVYLPVRSPSVSQTLAHSTASTAQNTAAHADDTQAIAVDFADNQQFTMESDGPGKYAQTLFVRNDDSLASSVQFTSELADAKGEPLPTAPFEVSPSSEIEKNSIAAVRIVIDAKNLKTPLSGYLKLVASAPGHKPSIKYRALKIPPPLPSLLATRLFWISLAATAAVAVIAFLVLLSMKIWLTQRMGSPTWSFSDSWGTNIAAVGALLNPLLSFSALPDQTFYLNKNSNLCLSLIFGAVIALAPSIYSLVRTPAPAPPPGSGTAIQYQGYVGFFILASLLTAWGAMGQVITIALLFAELSNVHTISHSISVCLVVVLAVIGLLLLIYEGRTIVQTSKLQKDAQAAIEGTASPLPTWSLL